MLINSIAGQLNGNVDGTGIDMVSMDQLASSDELNSSSPGFVGAGIHQLLDPINNLENMMNISVANGFSDPKNLVKFQELGRDYFSKLTVASKVIGMCTKGLNELLHPQ